LLHQVGISRNLFMMINHNCCIKLVPLVIFENNISKRRVGYCQLCEINHKRIRPGHFNYLLKWSSQKDINFEVKQSSI